MGLPGCTNRIGCKQCVDAFHKGMAWVTTDKGKHARVHLLMLDAWDDIDPEAVVWMPSHTGKDSVGTTLLGNGQAMTAIDRRGNAQADVLAKQAVEEHRVPQSCRDMLSQQGKLAADTLKWIGEASYLANNYPEAPF